MAKKITFTLLVLLIVSAFVFVSCSQEAGGGGKPGPATKPIERTPIELVAGTVSNNLVFNGSFDSGSEYDFSDEDASIEIVADVGVGGSKALSVVQTEKWGDVPLDFTEYYGRGKSYLISAKFKNNGSTNDEDLTGKISFTVVSGAVMDAVKAKKYYTEDGELWEGYYDCDDIYNGDWLSEQQAEEIFDIVVNTEGEELKDDEYVEVVCVLDAQTIENLLVDTTTKYAPGTEPTMAKLLAVFYVGDYKSEHGQSGYKYYLDDVVIKDLNSELPIDGITYNPNAGQEEEEEPEEPEEPEEEE